MQFSKHADLAIAACVMLLAVVALLAYERGLFGREPLEATTRQASPIVMSPTRTNQENLPTNTEPHAEVQPQAPWWVTDGDFAPIKDERPVPIALEMGVVHLGPGAALGGRRPLPDDNAWNQPIDHLPVDPLSEVLIASIGIDKHLHPDFGAGFWEGAPIGIPYYVVSRDQPLVPIMYTAYGDQSDPGPYPIPPDAEIEGAPSQDADRHVIVIDRDNWKLYEIFRAFRIADGQLWRAESGAVFDLIAHPNRPTGWTSADAAGLPIFPGLVRYDEVVEAGEIPHAVRFTVNRTRRAYVPPASHWASRSTDPRLPPMGMRVRLKAEYEISGFPEHVQTILTCLKRYGMILADNGGDWYISGAPDARWDDERLATLKQVPGAAFEVVLMKGLVED